MKLNGVEYDRKNLTLLRADPVPVFAMVNTKKGEVRGSLGAIYKERAVACWFAFREIWRPAEEIPFEIIVGYISYKGVFTRAEDVDDFGGFQEYTYYVASKKEKEEE